MNWATFLGCSLIKWKMRAGSSWILDSKFGHCVDINTNLSCHVDPVAMHHMLWVISWYI